MISSFREQEAPTAEHVRISNMRRHEAEQEEVVEPKHFASKQRHLSVDAATLSEKWGVSLAQAEMTLKSTTQNYMRSSLLPLARRYRVDNIFGQKSFNEHVYTNTMDARLTSICGNRYGQVFAIKDLFVDVYPMK